MFKLKKNNVNKWKNSKCVLLNTVSSYPDIYSISLIKMLNCENTLLLDDVTVLAL